MIKVDKEFKLEEAIKVEEAIKLEEIEYQNGTLEMAIR